MQNQMENAINKLSNPSSTGLPPSQRQKGFQEKDYHKARRTQSSLQWGHDLQCASLHAKLNPSAIDCDEHDSKCNVCGWLPGKLQ